MKSSIALRAIWLTARRAGWRRGFRRLERRLRLRLVNPRLGPRLYAVPEHHGLLAQPLARHSKQIDVLTYLAQLRQTSPHAHIWDTEVNTLRLLNQTPVSLQPPVGWHKWPIEDPLWSFQLHSWEWAWPVLTDLTKRAVVFSLWRDWLSQVTIGQGLAWEPYPTSRRLVVWLAAWHLLEGDNQLVLAIAQHANYLSHHLERDLDNNHLIANAKALAWAGLLLPDLPRADLWRDLGLKWLWRGLQEQVRPDGGHFENSSSYHLAVWQDGLETVLLGEACDAVVPARVKDVLYRMGVFAKGLSRPDGRLPLLNDSIEDEPIPAASLFRLAARTLQQDDFSPQANNQLMVEHGYDVRVFKDTGYVVVRCPTAKGETYCCFDAGELGPIHCPGHGHADTLSFELWSRGEALIIDPGTYQYPAGEWRDYFRDTAVHNTATVDGLNQSTFAGPFRLADMANGHLRSVRIEREQLEIIGEHNGYTRLADPVTHRRHIHFHHAQQLTLTDLFLGKHEHQIALYYHLAPCQANLERESVIQAVYPGGTRLRLQIDNNNSIAGSLSIIDGWISRTWYTRELSPIVVFKAKTKLPVTIKTILTISSEETSNG